MMLKLATVTQKATGHRYDVYAVPGSQSDYPVWARNGYACRCPCAWKAHHPSQRCKHILRLQQWLDEQRRTAPLYRESFALIS